MMDVEDMRSTADNRRRLSIRKLQSRVPLTQRDIVAGIVEAEAQIWSVGAEICERLDHLIKGGAEICERLDHLRGTLEE